MYNGTGGLSKNIRYFVSKPACAFDSFCSKGQHVCDEGFFVAYLLMNYRALWRKCRYDAGASQCAVDCHM